MITFLGPVKTVNLIGDGYIETVNIWKRSLRILAGSSDPYRLVFSPLDKEMTSILSVAGIFVRGEVDEVDRFLDQLQEDETIYVSEVTVH